MPFTIFHYPIAYLFGRTNKNLSLPGLIVGSVIPDIECLFMYFFFKNYPDHFILHSLIGGITLGTIIAIIITRFAYPYLISIIFRVNRKEIIRNCKINYYLIISCMLGILFHIIIDYPMHTYNPIFFPWIDHEIMIGPLVWLFSFDGDIQLGFLISNSIETIVMAIIGINILYKNKGNDLWNNLLVEI